ncbi:MAG: hydroxymethylpyrimidine/phosphomethylpyrimidine kinase [Burkholderiales bacterium]|nr:hydroxymethylpyrimidine/phosphomethylpyrimidine kinase [Burkholderiales bacterium]
MAARPPVVVSFAASDPTAGAGLQADLLAIAALGGHPATVVTALTVQDTRGVHALRAVEPDWVEVQAARLLADLPVRAFKLGVLGSAANATAVARIVAAYPQVPLVVDPVLASGRGDALADEATVAVLREALLARATVATPNSLEARRLAGCGPQTPLAECAARLVEAGCRYVLVTGTHEPGAKVVNTLYGPGGAIRADAWPRLPGEYHGSGCTLAAALAALLARGVALPEAAREAQAYTWRALAAGYPVGAGQRLPERLFSLRAHEPEHAARAVRDHA